MIGEHARAVLINAGRGEDVAHQVAEMVQGAVDRALKQLSGGIPPRQVAIDQGGQYRFPARGAADVGENPGAVSHVALPNGKVDPKRAVEDASGPLERMNEKSGNRNDAMPWVF